MHTDIGLRFKNAFINGRIVPLDYTLKTGDIVDIKTFKTKITATRWREKYLHTPTAKTKLTRHVRQQEKELMLDQVLTLIWSRLQTFWLPALWAKWDLLRGQYTDEEREQLLRQVYDKQITPTKLLRTVYQKQIDEIESKDKQKIKLKKAKKSKNSEEKVTGLWWVIIDMDKELEVILCPECKPSARKKAKIIAKSDKQVMKIHCVDCNALQTVKSDKLYEAHWKGRGINEYVLHLAMQVKDEHGNLLKLLEIFDFFNLSINNISTTPNKKHPGRSDVHFDVQISNITRIDYLMKELDARKAFVREVKKEVG